MAIFQILLAMILVGAGILLFKHGQGLPTAEEESDRDSSFLYEFFFGPPGYKRVRALISGVVLMFAGVLVIVAALFAV